MLESAEARVLLVSSDLERVRGSQGRLSGAGYAVRVCGVDAAGAAQLDQFEPQVVVVDPSVGEAGAAEFIERIRRLFPSTCFISPAELERPGPAEALNDGLAAPGAAESGVHLLQLVERGLEQARKQRDAARFKNRADAILSQARFDE